MSPKLHDSVPELIEQPALAGLIVQLMPVPVGSGSFIVTPVATPGPTLVTVIVNPIASPAFTVAASAVLLICRPGHCTLTEAFACTCGWFVACAVAVFGYVAQLANAVGLVTCTDADPPTPRSPKLQFKVLVVIEHAALAGLIDHVMPGPVGSGSLSVTLFAT